MAISHLNCGNRFHFTVKKRHLSVRLLFSLQFTSRPISARSTVSESRRGLNLIPVTFCNNDALFISPFPLRKEPNCVFLDELNSLEWFIEAACGTIYLQTKYQKAVRVLCSSAKWGLLQRCLCRQNLLKTY